jgi:hypothetical protein
MLSAPSFRNRAIAALRAESGIEEEVVITNDGREIITDVPFDRLISCGLPRCDVF